MFDCNVVSPLCLAVVSAAIADAFAVSAATARVTSLEIAVELAMIDADNASSALWNSVTISARELSASESTLLSTLSIRVLMATSAARNALSIASSRPVARVISEFKLFVKVVSADCLAEVSAAKSVVN